MKIKAVAFNNRRKAFEVRTAGREFLLPYSKAEPAPQGADPIVKIFVDPELGNEGFTFILRSGAEGSVVMDQVLDYNLDPSALHSQPGYYPHSDAFLQSLTGMPMLQLSARRYSDGNDQLRQRLGVDPE